MTAPHATQAGHGLRLIRAAVFTAVCVVLSAAGHTLASCATVPWWTLCAGFLAVFAVAAPLAGRRRSLPGIAAGLAFGQLTLHSLFGLGQHGATLPVAGSSTTDTSLAALAAQLVCGGNSVPLAPAEARRILESAGLDPVALAAHAEAHGQLAQGQSAQGLPALGPLAHAHMGQGLVEPAGGLVGLFSPGMLIGHLLAALAAGWLLGRGDAALFRLVELSRLSSQADPVRPLRAALAYVKALGTGLAGTPARTPRAVRAAAGPGISTGRDALQHTVIRRGPPTALALAA
ncbi:hypothetical protein J7E97_29970 [Streptomyces sp. ISL-66]|uniref:hypothetical protein n=1 Tax=Streptomyces sp. ISL-66 TaxID=2819186 RepID=UPI001BE8B79D|nr:hypothetical protein [Streptomyces sp. ISL-66]MBT2471973.1 hypothetical protein [Streptomyces sp. ISL-66]